MKDETLYVRPRAPNDLDGPFYSRWQNRWAATTEREVNVPRTMRPRPGSRVRPKS